MHDVTSVAGYTNDVNKKICGKAMDIPVTFSRDKNNGKTIKFVHGPC